MDDAGDIHVKWDNGRGLAIIPDEDDFHVVEQIKVMIVRPNEHPQVQNIDNDLETMQDIVGGYIEEIGLDDDSVLVCNEEGKLINLQANRSVGRDIIAGTFFIAGDDGGEELISLTEEQIQKYNERFFEIEEHTQEEMQRKIGFEFYSY